jgi:hypothetical protein
MRASSIALLSLVALGCGGGAKRPTTGSSDMGSGGGACQVENFACQADGACCAGLLCVGNVCISPSTGGADMATTPKPDLSTGGGGGGGTVCSGIVSCENAAMSQQDVQACLKAGSKTGLPLFQNLIVCLFGDSMSNTQGACSDFGGAVCDSSSMNYNKNNCNACLSAAQKMGGACYQALLMCAADCNSDSDCAQLMCSGAACTCQQHVCM